VATDKVRKLADVITQSALLRFCSDVVSGYSFQGQSCPVTRNETAAIAKIKAVWPVS
jgi:hypothetical protein